MEETIGLIIGIISFIIFLIVPFVLIIRAIVKPEQIDVEDGKVKIKKGAIFYNLALQNPLYVKLTIFFIFIGTLTSLLMYYRGVDVEVFEMFAKALLFTCIIFLGIQIIEERRTFLFGFLPIIIYCAYAWKIIWKITKFISIKLYFLLKKLFEGIVYIVFFLPFKVLNKVLGVK